MEMGVLAVTTKLQEKGLLVLGTEVPMQAMELEGAGFRILHYIRFGRECGVCISWSLEYCNII